MALLTAGKDPHYAKGLMRELAALGVPLVVIGDTELSTAEEIVTGRVDFHDFVGALDPRDTRLMKIWRVVSYYIRLTMFAARTDATVFHVLWFRRFPRLERTLLVAYLKALKKIVIFTAHNVDDQARDGGRGRQASLRCLYRLVDHVFVHTKAMKEELSENFAVPADNVTVVPFGINDVIPVATETRIAAKRKFGLSAEERALLFFGNITPYKGLEDLLHALSHLQGDGTVVKLIIAGRPRETGPQSYWAGIEQLIDDLRLTVHVRKEIGYIPDEDVGRLFRAADVTVLPYRRIYQSGVLALSYAQGRPVIAADVGPMRDSVHEGETGLLFKGGDSADLARAIREYFSSDMFRSLERRSATITDYGRQMFSWAANARATVDTYRALGGGGRQG